MDGLCPICNKRRGGAVSHSSCSKKLQAAAQKRLTKPSMGRGGAPNVLPSGLPVTVEQKHAAYLKQVGKQYGTSRNGEYWKKFD